MANELQAYWLKRKDVRKGPIADSVECLTAESIVEICKDMGLFLCAEPGRGVTGELHNRGGATYYRLHLGVPASEQMSNKPGYSDGMEQGSSIIWVAQELHREIVELSKDDMSDIRRVSSWPIERTFVYIDVSDFSRHKPGTQVHIVSSLVRIVRIDGYWLSGYGRYAREGLESMICIGDGYIYVFRKPSHAVMFAGYLAHLIEHLSAIDRLQGMDIHFRAGVHTGDVYCFWDFGRDRWNYIGAGINGGQRVLEAIGKDTDDVVYISGQVRRKLKEEGYDQHPIDSILSALHNRGRRADKHGGLWRVYELNHTTLIASDFNRVKVE